MVPRVVTLAIAVGVLLLTSSCQREVPQSAVRYVALGDSYTIGHDVAEGDRFPNQLVDRLTKEGVSISLVANPSRTGWTTQDLIDKELSVFDQSDPGFVTLLIGVNDWVQGVAPQRFRDNFARILDHLLNEVPSKRIIVVTIPDFSVTPIGSNFGAGRDISKGIKEFNAILTEESRRRSVAVIDIFPVSQEAKEDGSLIASDGLHPSGKQYSKWVDLILPAARSSISLNERTI